MYLATLHCIRNSPQRPRSESVRSRASFYQNTLLYTNIYNLALRHLKRSGLDFETASAAAAELAGRCSPRHSFDSGRRSRFGSVASDSSIVRRKSLLSPKIRRGSSSGDFSSSSFRKSSLSPKILHGSGSADSATLGTSVGLCANCGHDTKQLLSVLDMMADQHLAEMNELKDELAAERRARAALEAQAASVLESVEAKHAAEVNELMKRIKTSRSERSDAKSKRGGDALQWKISDDEVLHDDKKRHQEELCALRRTLEAQQLAALSRASEEHARLLDEYRKETEVQVMLAFDKWERENAKLASLAGVSVDDSFTHSVSHFVAAAGRKAARTESISSILDCLSHSNSPIVAAARAAKLPLDDEKNVKLPLPSPILLGKKSAYINERKEKEVKNSDKQVEPNENNSKKCDINGVLEIMKREIKTYPSHLQPLFNLDSSTEGSQQSLTVETKSFRKASGIAKLTSKEGESDTTVSPKLYTPTYFEKRLRDDITCKKDMESPSKLRQPSPRNKWRTQKKMSF
eukprot:g5870.t1